MFNMTADELLERIPLAYSLHTLFNDQTSV